MDSPGETKEGSRFRLTAFEPLIEIVGWFVSLVPRQLRSTRPKLNFLLVHYLYMIGMSIAVSIIIFGAAFMPYTDALFFAAGAATQSGLNTININEIYLYQQITLMLVACVCNPIFINTAVVFVRLYWFDKRFQHIVQEIREKRKRRAPTMTQERSQTVDVPELENGVNGREIRVLHETTKPNGWSGSTANAQDEADFKEKLGLEANARSVSPTPEGSNKSSEENGLDRAAGEGGTFARAEEEQQQTSKSDAQDQEHHMGLHPSLRRDIKFADEVPGTEPTNSEDTSERPGQGDPQDLSRHIRFLERQQRNVKESTTLRIPGPREFDEGGKPTEVDSSDDEGGFRRLDTRDSTSRLDSERHRRGTSTEDGEMMSGDNHDNAGGITFDESEHPARRHETSNLERPPTAASRFANTKARLGAGLRHVHSRSNSQRLKLSEARTSLARTFSTAKIGREEEQRMPYLSWQATTGRNSTFFGLTEEQREELGGIEYRALKTLAKVLIIYFVGFHISSLLVNLPWIVSKPRYEGIITSFGVNPKWWAVFTSASLFNDLGYTVTPNSMYSFKEATLVLLYGSFLIIIGNTGFPVMLRFVIWVSSKFVRRGTPLWEELRFLLDHPRRCFTLLFPSKATWWLFWILVLLNGIDLIFFIVLDLHDKTVTRLAPGYRVLGGWFQATSTRTAGFSVVNLSNLHPAIQVSYMIMMYISVFPIAISVRRTNVYEEKSLGIWGGEEHEKDDQDPSYVGQHLRRQLSFDLWFVFLGFFIICIVEGDRLADNDEYGFTMFAVLFEIVSAYGTVGLSLGYPGTDPSFSAQFRVISKLVIMAMMIRGRHRGLPYALDRAILLPSEHLQKKEAEDADRRHQRRASVTSGADEQGRLIHHGTSSDTEIEKVSRQRRSLSNTNPQDPANSSAIDDVQSQEAMPQRRRRGSGLSTASGKTAPERRRTLGSVLTGALSAGPTISKHD